MGCGTSKSKKTNQIDTNKVERKETGGIRTQKVLNAWEATPALSTPYPQGKIDINKLIKTDSYEVGSIYDPNPEVVPYYVEGEYVPAREFYAITPAKPVSSKFVNKQISEKIIINDQNKVINAKNRNIEGNQQREVLYA